MDKIHNDTPSHHDDIPDQELFEPVEPEEREPSRWGLVRKWLTWGGALVAILGLLYLGGVYQALLFHRTPASFVREPLQQIVSGQEITLPVRVIVLGAGIQGGERWDDAAVARLTANTSAILHQVGIGLSIVQIDRRIISNEMLRGFLENPAGVAGVVEHSQREITIVLLESLQGLNGIAFTGSDIVAVADYSGSFNDRVLAHEVGHILGLGHVGDINRLMAQGSEGLTLSRSEAETIRSNAGSFVGN